MTSKKIWTKEEEHLLLKIYTLYTNQELAEMFDCKVSAINTKRTALGVGIKQLEAEANKDVPQGYRRCKECEQVLLLEEHFYVLNRNKPNKGRMKICKSCNSTMKSKARADINNTIKIDNCNCDIIVKNDSTYQPKKKNKTHHCVKCGKDYSIK